MKALVTGSGGMLAHAVAEVLHGGGHDVVALDRATLDVTDADAVADALALHAPDAVFHCAAWTRVDDAEDDEAGARRVNAAGTANVAAACARQGARLVYPSTDYVFDGSARVPYAVDAPTAPISAYGRSKLAGELAAAAADGIIVRTSWLYGPNGRNFVRTILARAESGQPLRVVADQHGAPTYTLDLAEMLVALVLRNAPAGRYHATNSGVTTWHGFAVAALEAAGLGVQVAAVSSNEFAARAPRPRYSVLDCATTYAITGAARSWQMALRDYVRSERPAPQEVP